MSRGVYQSRRISAHPIGVSTTQQKDSCTVPQDSPVYTKDSLPGTSTQLQLKMIDARPTRRTRYKQGTIQLLGYTITNSLKCTYIRVLCKGEVRIAVAVVSSSKSETRTVSFLTNVSPAAKCHHLEERLQHSEFLFVLSSPRSI